MLEYWKVMMDICSIFNN